MAKNRTYTGGKQSVGTPTIGREGYFQLMRMIRKERERNAETKRAADSVPADADAP